MSEPIVSWLRDEARAASPDFPDHTPAGRILGLLTSLARIDPYTGWDSTYCFYCFADEAQPHNEECTWLLIASSAGPAQGGTE